MSEETIEGLTKELNRLADGYYLKSSPEARNDCSIRMSELSDRLYTLKQLNRSAPKGTSDE